MQCAQFGKIKGMTWQKDAFSEGPPENRNQPESTGINRNQPESKSSVPKSYTKPPKSTA